VIITKLQVELVVSSESSCAVRLARHSQNASARHVERVESCRVESSQVEFWLYWTFRRQIKWRSVNSRTSQPVFILAPLDPGEQLVNICHVYA